MSTIVTRAGKGSALTHTELDANFTNLNTDKIESTLAADLDVKNFAITTTGTNGYIDVADQVEMDKDVADYSLVINNQNEQGLGLRIKAGDKDYAGSLAILSVADKNNVQQFIVKADGQINAAETMTVGRAGTDSGTQGIIQLVPGTISTLNASDDLNITTNSGVLSLNSLSFPGSDGTTGQVLTTNGSGALSFADKASVVDDLTPELGGPLDPKGQMIGPDSTREYQIQGNQANPSDANYDSFNATGRQYGPIRIQEVTQPSNRVHSNMNLSLVTYTANAGSQNSRLRHNYNEAVVEMDGNDNTRTGFGSGHNGMFVSSMARNSNAGNGASTLAQSTGITIAPQVASTSTGGLTVTDMRAINMEPNINDANGTVSTLYGLYYNTNNAGTISTQYSFYGAEQPATVYNQGGFELPSFTVANLDASSPVQVTRRTGNMVLCTDETGGSIPAFWDGTNWRRMSDRAIITA